jgi:MoxR-like ATPase
MSTSQSAGAGQMSPEEAVRRVAQAREMLSNEVHKVIIGQDEMLEEMLICIFARGHCLTIGVPGLAKTLTVSTLAKALAMNFSRIQFTPDLMPSDITGTEIIDQDQGDRPAPVAVRARGRSSPTSILADEINRTPPKTQAALLQSMQERQVTAGGVQARAASNPFFVLATQNPLEQEGTYPLPEAQLDRFMLSINIGYPSRDEEREIVLATTQTVKKEINPVLQGRDIIWIQQLVRQVPASTHMLDYAVDLVRATRPREDYSPDFVKNWLAWGSGPRAAQNMILGAKARAILNGRFAVTADDIRAIAYPVLRHRIFTNFNADAEGVDVNQVIDKILDTVKEPSYGDAVSAQPRSVQVPLPPTPAKPGEMASPSPGPPPGSAQSTPAASEIAAPPKSPAPTTATPPASKRPTGPKPFSGPTAPPTGPTPPPSGLR